MSLSSAIGGLFGGGPSAPVFDTAKATADQTAANTAAMKANSLNRGGPFGSSTFQTDANGNPVGITNSLDPSLNAGAFGSNLGLLGGQLPGTTIDFSNTNPQQIAQQNYAAYAAMTAPQRALQQSTLNTDLTNRGLPVGGEAWNNAQQPVQLANSIADTNAAALAWNAVPGMAATMTNTAIQQGQSPYQLAGLNLGLLNNMIPLSGQAQQYNTNPVNTTSLDQTAFTGAMDAYKANKASDASLLNTIGTVGGYLAGGPAGAAMWKAGTGLFNNGSMGAAG